MSEETNWKEIAEHLQESLAAKEEELRVVAELGRSLLQHKQDSEDKVRKAEQENRVYKDQIDELETELARIKKRVTAEQFLEGSLREENEKIKEEYQNLKHSYDQLIDLHRTEKDYAKTKEKQLVRDFTEHKEKTNDLEAQLENSKSNLESYQQKEQEQKKTILQLESEKSELINLLEQLEEKMITLESSLEVEKRKVEFKNNELKKLGEEFDSQGEEYEKQSKRLQEMITDVVQRNHHLTKENEHLRESLHVTRTEMESKRPVLEETLDQITQETNHVTSASLYAELQETIKKNELDEESIEKLDTQITQTDYFFLACAAVKIGLVMKFPEKSTEVFQVNVQKLYENAINENIPFHEWHSWITAQFGHQIMNEELTPEPPKQRPPPAVAILQPNGFSPFPDQDAELHKLFKVQDDESVLAYYETQLGNLSGVLFVTENGLYFYSKKSSTGKQEGTKYQVLYDDIEFIRKSRFNFFSKESLIVKVKQPDQKWEFSGFQNLDEAVDIIKKLWETSFELEIKEKQTEQIRKAISGKLQSLKK